MGAVWAGASLRAEPETPPASPPGQPATGHSGGTDGAQLLPRPRKWGSHLPCWSHWVHPACLVQGCTREPSAHQPRACVAPLVPEAHSSLSAPPTTCPVDSVGWVAIRAMQANVLFLFIFFQVKNRKEGRLPIRHEERSSKGWEPPPARASWDRDGSCSVPGRGYQDAARTRGEPPFTFGELVTALWSDTEETASFRESSLTACRSLLGPSEAGGHPAAEPLPQGRCSPVLPHTAPISADLEPKERPGKEARRHWGAGDLGTLARSCSGRKLRQRALSPLRSQPQGCWEHGAPSSWPLTGSSHGWKVP